MTSPYIPTFQTKQKRDCSEGPFRGLECISALSEETTTLSLRETS